MTTANPTMTLQLELTQIKRDWCDRMASRVLSAMAGRDFCADDLHPILEAPEHDNWFGVLLAQLKNSGRIERVGYRPSARPERNGGLVRVWRVVFA